MEEFYRLIEEISRNSGIDKEIILKHFNVFLAKINPEAPVDLEFLELEFIKTLALIKEEQNAIQKHRRV